MSAIVTRAPEERAIGAEGEPVPTVRADVLRALLWTSAALRACREDDRDVIRGKDDCAWMGSRTVGEILDEADAVLNGLARPDHAPAADPRGRADGDTTTPITRNTPAPPRQDNPTVPQRAARLATEGER